MNNGTYTPAHMKHAITSLGMQSTGYRRILLQSSMLNGLPAEIKEKVLSSGQARTWSRGKMIFMDGSPIEHFYYVISGKVKEFYYNGSGEEYLRRVIYPGCYISLYSLFKEETVHTYSCATLAETEVIAWSTDNFLELLKQCPKLGMQVALVLSNIYERTCRLNCICKKKSARAKVAGYLLSKLNPTCGHYSCSIIGDCRWIDLRPISLAAEEVGLARETFSRNLTRLEKEGFIAQERGIVSIANMDGLKLVSGVEDSVIV